MKKLKLIIGALITVLCGWLWREGGAGKKWMRRILIPIILSSYYALTLKWWLFFTTGVGYGTTIPLGYGVPDQNDPKGSWLGRIFKIGWLTRGVYGALVSLAGALGCAIYTGKYIYLGCYVAMNFVLGCVLSALKVKDIWIERIIGAGIASVVLWI